MNTEFLIETSLKGLIAASVGRESSVLAYGSLIEQIRTRCGTDVANLFAEPVPPSKLDPQNPTLSWYTSLDGQMIELARIDDVARAPVVAALKARLGKLKPLLETPDVGPIIASWLFIPSSASILTVGGNPVLVNWGYLPVDIARSLSDRETHFADTIGRYAPDLTVPPFTPEEQASYGARINRKAAASATRPPAAASPAPKADDAKAPARTASPPGPRRGWIPALLASLVAACFLGFLLWPGVLVYPDRTADQARVDRDAQVLRDGNRTLEEKLQQLENAARERVCRAPDGRLTPLAPGPGGGPAPSVPSPLTPAPSRVQVQPPNSQATVPLEQLFESAVVFVFGPSVDGDGVGTGSGFFVMPNTIVTNRHVVQGIRSSQVFVTNKVLGKVLPARVVAQSAPDPTEESRGLKNPDLAILEVESGDRPFMKIGPSPPKGADVWAVGYPGYITYDQTRTRQLLSGNQNVAPDSTFERGIVTTKPDGDAVKQLIHSARISKGNSGGPLADQCGRVVGINTLIHGDPDVSIVTGIAQDPSVIAAFTSQHGVNAVVDDTPCNPVVAAAPPPAAPAPAPSGPVTPAPPTAARPDAAPAAPARAPGPSSPRSP